MISLTGPITAKGADKKLATTFNICFDHQIISESDLLFYLLQRSTFCGFFIPHFGLYLYCIRTCPKNSSIFAAQKMNVSVELLQSSFLMSEIQYFYVFCHNGRSSRRRCNSTGAAIYGQRVELFGILQVCAV